MKRIAVFQSNWWLQVHTCNFIQALLDQGAEVHFFHSEPLGQFAPLPTSERFHLYTQANGRLPVQSVGRARVPSARPLALRKALSLDDGERATLQQNLLSKSLGHAPYRISKIARATRGALPGMLAEMRGSVFGFLYDQAFIAHMQSLLKEKGPWDMAVFIETSSLLLLPHLHNHLPPPAYYSLEIYNHHEIANCLRSALGGADIPSSKTAAKWMRASFPLISKVIIQDELRYQYLQNAYQLPAQDLFYLPISISGEQTATAAKTRLFRERWKIPAQGKVILSPGWMNSGRAIEELVEHAQHFPPDWHLVLHFGVAQHLNRTQFVESFDRGKRVTVSTFFVEESEMDDLYSAADVGLALYTSSSINDQLTARSSEKIARFAKVGVPIITCNHPGYAELFEQHPFGIALPTLKTLPDAIAQLLERREYFSERAHEAFRSVFDFDRYTTALYRWLSGEAPASRRAHSPASPAGAAQPS